MLKVIIWKQDLLRHLLDLGLKMKNQIRLLYYLMLLVLLTSCQHTLVLYLLNNTEHDISATSYDTVGESQKYFIKRGYSHEMASPAKLLLKFDRGIWEYTNFPRLDKRYVESGGFWPDKYRFQVEKDGAIYILLPETKMITTNLPPQPHGFPIRPK